MEAHGTNYDGLTLVVLKGLAGNRGMPNVNRARKGEIVAWLRAQDNAARPAPQPFANGQIENIHHAPFGGPHAQGDLVNAGAAPIGAMPDPQLAAQLDGLTTIVGHLANNLTRLATTVGNMLDRRALNAQAHAGFNLAIGGLFPPVTAMNPIPANQIQEFAPHVSGDLIEAVQNNHLAVWDMWMLDSTRATEVSKAPLRTTGEDQDRERAMARAALRYTTFSDIFRAWSWYAIIRDCFTPGYAKYLMVYLHHLASVGSSIPTGPHKFGKLINYHFHVVDRRLSQGDRLDDREWLVTDQNDVQIFVTDYTPPSPEDRRIQPTPARPNVPWALKCIGSLTNPVPCYRYNAMEECPGALCTFRHMCENCREDLHPQSLCPALYGSFATELLQAYEADVGDGGNGASGSGFGGDHGAA